MSPKDASLAASMIRARMISALPTVLPVRRRATLASSSNASAVSRSSRAVYLIFTRQPAGDEMLVVSLRWRVERVPASAGEAVIMPGCGCR